MIRRGWRGRLRPVPYAQSCPVAGLSVSASLNELELVKLRPLHPCPTLASTGLAGLGHFAGQG